MKHSNIAKRYAVAAVNHLSPDKYHEVLGQLKTMKKIVNETPDLVKVISSEIVRKHDKIELITDLFGQFENKDFWIQLFTVLIQKQRSNIIVAFLFEFEILLNRATNVQNVKLLLAFPQSENTLDLIKQEVGRILNCNVNFDVEIDKDIMACFIAMSDTRYIDASLRTNIERFALKRKKL